VFDPAIRREVPTIKPRVSSKRAEEQKEHEESEEWEGVSEMKEINSTSLPR